MIGSDGEIRRNAYPIAAVSTEELQKDSVNHPPHYTSDPSGIECITIVEHRNYLIGNSIKYLWRAGLKGSENSEKHIEDLQKAVWCINREVERIKKCTSS